MALHKSRPLERKIPLDKKNKPSLNTIAYCYGYCSATNGTFRSESRALLLHKPALLHPSQFFPIPGGILGTKWHWLASQYAMVTRYQMKASSTLFDIHSIKSKKKKVKSKEKDRIYRSQLLMQYHFFYLPTDESLVVTFNKLANTEISQLVVVVESTAHKSKKVTGSLLCTIP